MGMDVYGHNPTTEDGSYFRNAIWEWDPLADYICHKAPWDIVGKCDFWHSNDGDGLDASAALALAAFLQAEIDSGRCEQYARVYADRDETEPDKQVDLVTRG